MLMHSTYTRDMSMDPHFIDTLPKQVDGIDACVKHVDKTLKYRHIEQMCR